MTERSETKPEAADQDRADALRYRLLRERGRCDSKRGAGMVLGGVLKADVAFRYWLTAEALDAALDAAIAASGLDAKRSV
jgi:hypothetical protein